MQREEDAPLQRRIQEITGKLPLGSALEGEVTSRFQVLQVLQGSPAVQGWGWIGRASKGTCP